MLYKTQIIILKKMPFKDRDILITAFSKELGKISIIAKGAQSSKSKFLSGVQPMAYSEVLLYKGKNFYNLNSLDIIKNFYSIREDIIKLSIAGFFLNITQNSLLEEKNTRLFDLLLNSLDNLELEIFDYNFLIIYYQLKLIDFTGFKPYIKNCSECESHNSDTWYFNIEDGNLVCKNCINQYSYNMKISSKIIKLINVIYNRDINDLISIKLHDKIYMQTQDILKKYILYHLEKNSFKSLDFFDKMKGEILNGK